MAGAVTKDLIDISLADSATGWVGTSGGLDTEVKKQNTGSWTYQTPKNGIGNGNFTPAANINMTANYTTPHLYWVMRCDVFPFCEALNTGATNSGLMVKVSDGAGNFVQWHIAGSDTWDGGWRNFVLDLTNTANIHSTSGTLSLADVDLIEWITDNSNSGNIRTIDNTWLDAVRYGAGLIASSATTEAFNFTDITLLDVGLNAGVNDNYYMVSQKFNGVTFTNGTIQIGGAGLTANFVSNGEEMYFLDAIVASDFHGLKGVAGTAVDVDITGLVAKTLGTTGAEFDFSDAGLDSFIMRSSTLIDMGAISFGLGSVETSGFFGSGASAVANCTVTDSSWTLSAAITLTGTSTITNCTITESSATSALLVSDLDDIITSHFVGDDTGHAIELSSIGAGSMAWNSTFDTATYAIIDGSTGNETIHVNVASGNLTINVASGSTTPTIRTAGAVVTLVVNPVTVKITVKNQETDAVVQGAAVVVRAATTGALAFEASVTITRVGAVATVAHTAHGLVTDNWVEIEDADQSEYNRLRQITVVDANSYTFAVIGTPTTPATGTIISTAVVINGLTDVLGEISDTRTYTVDQAFTGNVRKGSGAPVFVAAPLANTISKDNGFAQTVSLIPD